MDGGGRPLARAHDRPRRHLRPRHHTRRLDGRAARDLGHTARHGRAGHRRRAGSGHPHRLRAYEFRTGARLHGPDARHDDRRDPRGSGVHRLLHERPPGRSARGGTRREGASRGADRARHGRARIAAGEEGRRSRGPARDPARRRLRVARAGLLDVPGHERRRPRCRPALRLDQQPQLRRAPSPAMAAAAAIRGHFTDIRDWTYR